MEFKRLRLSGFKSFVEPTELVIEKGLTGVVGPNGCGKSNLLEALRWVMGESSYKNMRGSGMDDVIFSGSGSRPSRNTAEVAVVLDNTNRTAPPAFNDAESLEVTRRIEREAGSAYRINGKDVRARDVQLLFADASTGARSPSLVRQGQIGELISAKPQARRKILEEAAGITGLHTRRHEAELRLRAAETNLTRLDDVIAQIESQLSSLKRQARQAGRYKSLSAEIRQAEAIQLHLKWVEAATLLESEQTALNEITREMAEHTRSASEASRAQEQAAAALPALRDEELTAAAILQRLTVERETLEAEEKRAADRKQELEQRGTQVNADLNREQEIVRDTADVVERLEKEAGELGSAHEGDEGRRAELQETLTECEAALKQREQDFDEVSQAAASLRSQRAGLESAVAEQTRRIARFDEQLAKIEADIEALGIDTEAAERIATLGRDVETAVAEAEAAEQAALAAEATLGEKRSAEQEKRAILDGCEKESNRLATEVQTLSKLLAVTDNELWPPLIDALKVEPGFEKALGAALGDDLDVPIDNAAPVHWDALGALDPVPTLPDGVASLADHVVAPDALSRRLSQVGIVEAGAGKALQGGLKPGQRLVSASGDLWRWDGFTAAADAPTAAALRLEQRNRLGDLEKEAEKASRVAHEARDAYNAAREETRSAVEAEAAAREAWRAATRAVSSLRDELARSERAASETTARHSALVEARNRVTSEREDAGRTLAERSESLEALEPGDAMEARLLTLREAVAEARAVYSDARANHDGMAREIKSRTDRLAAIEQEKKAWIARADKARHQIETLVERSREIETEAGSMADLPAQWTARREKLFASLSQAEERRKKAADALAEAESHVQQCEAALRKAQGTLSDTRENRARMEARVEGARERLQEMTGRIDEVLHCAPDKVLDHAGLAEDAKLPGIEETERKLERLRAERERLGGVNLRAEEEARELTEQLDGLVQERDDLIKAIHRLRQGIGSLNREGRERLLAAFETVKDHFERLFTHLFGGGQAELKLTESDDPLEAGLEIIARPPGKRPQVMSLLSGGEQALTAMSLIFAVFLTNPSPICVLDEVDAPLDDANVERFCNLLDEMIRSTDTRFLVITHHALTMSRMNRLFGVTMAERGVSQLVSVDLETAEQFREAV